MIREIMRTEIGTAELGSPNFRIPSYVIRNVRILDSGLGLDYTGDIFIAEGRIADSADLIRENTKTIEIDGSGKWLFPGLTDMHVHLREPGNEESETIETGLRAAIAGGVTTVGVMPNTLPSLDSPESMNLLLEKSKVLGLADVIPVPCVTRGRQGRESVDYRLLHTCGANSFTDDGSPIYDDRIFAEALEQTSLFSGLIIEHSEITSSTQGAVNAGDIALKLNVEGIPESTEFEDVRRCIELLRVTSGRLHLTHLSSPESIRLVVAAKDDGLNITCDVTPHHLALDENALLSYGANAKMNPPLRSSRSRRELVELVLSGCVDAVASDHAPHADYLKAKPLDNAAFGITGLETLLPVTLDILHYKGGMSVLEVHALLSSSPNSILKAPVKALSTGSNADVVLFDPDLEYTIQNVGTFSKSGNTPFRTVHLKGRVTAVWKKSLIYRDGEFC